MIATTSGANGIENIITYNMIYIIMIIYRKMMATDVYYTFNVRYTREHRLLELLFIGIVYNDMGGTARVIPTYPVVLRVV